MRAETTVISSSTALLSPRLPRGARVVGTCSIRSHWMIFEPFRQTAAELSHIPGCRALTGFLVESFTELTPHRVSTRLSGRAKGTRGSVSIMVNGHEELSDRSAPYADFGHGSLFEGAPGAAGFLATKESPSLQALQTMHVSWWATCIFQSASSKSKHSGLGTAENLRPWTGAASA